MLPLAQWLCKQLTPCVAGLHRPMASPVQNLLCTSAKLSLNRAGKHSGVNPRRYIEAATTYAMMLYLQAR